MTDLLANYIVTAGLINATRAKLEAKNSDGAYIHPGLPGMFTAELIGKNDADSKPATAFISSGWMSPDEIAYLNSQLPGPFQYSDGTYVDAQGKTQKENGHGYLDRKGYRLKPGALV